MLDSNWSILEENACTSSFLTSEILRNYSILYHMVIACNKACTSFVVDSFSFNNLEISGHFNTNTFISVPKLILCWSVKEEPKSLLRRYSIYWTLFLFQLVTRQSISWTLLIILSGCKMSNLSLWMQSTSLLYHSWVHPTLSFRITMMMIPLLTVLQLVFKQSKFFVLILLSSNPMSFL